MSDRYDFQDEWYDTPQGYVGPFHTPGENVNPNDYLDAAQWHQAQEVQESMMREAWTNQAYKASNPASYLDYDRTSSLETPTKSDIDQQQTGQYYDLYAAGYGSKETQAKSDEQRQDEQRQPKYHGRIVSELRGLAQNGHQYQSQSEVDDKINEGDTAPGRQPPPNRDTSAQRLPAKPLIQGLPAKPNAAQLQDEQYMAEHRRQLGQLRRQSAESWLSDYAAKPITTSSKLLDGEDVAQTASINQLEPEDVGRMPSSLNNSAMKTAALILVSLVMLMLLVAAVVITIRGL